MTDLRLRLASPKLLTAPGGYDAFSALRVAQAGFEAACLPGASIAYTRFGRPDTGFGNALNDVIGTPAMLAQGRRYG